MQADLQVMIRKLALKYNRPASEIEEILEAPFKMAAEVISSGNKEDHAFFNIRIPAIGIFIAREAILQKMYKSSEVTLKQDDATLKMAKVKILNKGRRKKHE